MRIIRVICLLILMLASYLALIKTAVSNNQTNVALVIIIGGIIIAYVSIFAVVKTPASIRYKDQKEGESHPPKSAS